MSVTAPPPPNTPATPIGSSAVRSPGGITQIPGANNIVPGRRSLPPAARIPSAPPGMGAGASQLIRSTPIGGGSIGNKIAPLTQPEVRPLEPALPDLPFNILSPGNSPQQNFPELGGQSESFPYPNAAPGSTLIGFFRDRFFPPKSPQAQPPQTQPQEVTILPVRLSRAEQYAIANFEVYLENPQINYDVIVGRFPTKLLAKTTGIYQVNTYPNLERPAPPGQLGPGFPFSYKADQFGNTTRWDYPDLNTGSERFRALGSPVLNDAGTSAIVDAPPAPSVPDTAPKTPDPIFPPDLPQSPVIVPFKRPQTPVDPQPQPDPNPPEPEPQPEPEPEPPTPEPEPEPEPEPPTPTPFKPGRIPPPETDPPFIPTPTPDKIPYPPFRTPDPIPTPDPAPDPTRTPDPAPVIVPPVIPQPTPQQVPEISPKPAPKPITDPTRIPDPAPVVVPPIIPQTFPNPTPTPNPDPQPQPQPNPTPTPNPQPQDPTAPIVPQTFPAPVPAPNSGIPPGLTPPGSQSAPDAPIVPNPPPVPVPPPAQLPPGTSDGVPQNDPGDPGGTPEPDPPPEPEKEDPCKDPCLKQISQAQQSSKSVPVTVKVFESCGENDEPIFGSFTFLAPENMAEFIAFSARKLADIEGKQCKKCSESVHGSPEWWEVRPGGDRPQLLLMFSPENSRRANYQITIPHWSGGKPDPKNPPIRAYKKGRIMGVYHLADGSKLIVNAETKEEVIRVISTLKNSISPAQKTKTKTNYTDLEDSDIKIQLMTCRYACYYPQGQKSKTPEWIIEFDV